METREQAHDELTVQAATPATAPESTPIQEPTTTIEQPQSATGTTDDVPDMHNVTTLEQLAQLLQQMAEKDPADISGEELRRLRQQFNALHKATLQPAEITIVAEQTESAEPVDAQNTEEESEPAVVTEIKTLLEQIREKKNAWTIEQEKIKVDNLAKKNAIIDEIISLAGDTDNVNRTFPRYRELVEEFTSIGDVPPTDETALWKRFSTAREQYSDNLKINKELRDYDFKKNLEAKEGLIDEARKLVDHPDLIEAYRKLGDLHDQWRRIGPVAKELRDELWDKFKESSTEVRRRYQSHFEARKNEETKNEQAKTALCETLEAIDLESLQSQSAWEKATQEVKDVQDQWKQLGFASRKINNVLFARYRAFCDKFFEAKAAYYRQAREALSNNLTLKQAIVEKAEALKDSTEWRKAADEFVAMQKEWKTIGPVARRQSEELWQRFISACDYFFDRKKKQGNDQRHQQQDNLKAKREIIEQIEAVPDNSTREVILETLKSKQQAWQEIGHVPFKEKDKLYEQYRAALDRLRAMLDSQQSRVRMDRFQSNLNEISGDQNKLQRERDRLLRAAEAKRAEIRTYENNLGFLSSKSKSGDSMLRDLQHRIDRDKAELETLLEKIKLIDKEA